ELLDLAPGQRVLEIGCGTGWLAAMMGHAVGPAGEVTGIEILADLARCARAAVDRLGLAQVAVRVADGTRPAAREAAYDRVVVTAGSYAIPDLLFDCVAEGGLALLPVSN